MAKIKKMASGGKSSLGMKSVKAGFDKNPGVTRADIIVAAKGEAKNGKKVKKAQVGGLFGRKQEKVGSREARKELRKAQRTIRGKARGTGCGPGGCAKYKKGGKVKSAAMGTTTPGMRQSRAAAAAGRGAASRRASRAASALSRPMMKMGGKCRGGCY